MLCPGYFDVVIVGGGLVGASLAVALLPAVQEHGLKVALVEAVDVRTGIPVKSGNTNKNSKQSLQENAQESLQQNLQPSFDARATALSFGSRQLYREMGVWQQLAKGATPIEHIHVSDRGRFGSLRLHAREHQVEALGYVVENVLMGEALYRQLQEVEGVSIFAPAQVSKVTPIAQGHRVHCSLHCSSDSSTTSVDNEQLLDASLVVVADGGRSPLCEQLGIARQQERYRQHAIIANIACARFHDYVAYERFTEQGPLALLPMAPTKMPPPMPANRSRSHRMAMVLTVADDQYQQIMAMADEAFAEFLQRQFGYRLGRIQRVGERQSYPLILQRAREQIRPGMVVIGNAAHNLHPIAGQGFNLALRGVSNLAQLLCQAHAEGQSIYQLSLLRDYLRQQQRDQDKTIGFTDQALRLFSNDDLLLGIARDLGLVGMQLLPAARNLFARHAMGLAG